MFCNTMDERIGTTLEGRYRIDSELAAGGMGVVYRGEHLGLGRKLAIKFLHAHIASDPSLIERFEVEAQAMAKLQHPNCAAVIDSGVAEGAPYVVMNLITGESLGDLLARTRVSPPRALGIIRQILSGLAHAHEQGIIHRDIKPDNIMVDRSDAFGDRVSILDFGLAKLRERSPGLTSGFIVGTPNYMAPEQTLMQPVDERTDIYATGVVLYEMLTGQKPFQSDEVIEILRMHREEPIPHLVEVRSDLVLSDELDAIVQCALAKRQSERYPSAAAFATALGRTPEASLKPSSNEGERAAQPLAVDVAVVAKRTKKPAGKAGHTGVDNAVPRETLGNAPTAPLAIPGTADEIVDEIVDEIAAEAAAKANPVQPNGATVALSDSDILTDDTGQSGAGGTDESGRQNQESDAQANSSDATPHESLATASTEPATLPDGTPTDDPEACAQDDTGHSATEVTSTAEALQSAANGERAASAPAATLPEPLHEPSASPSPHRSGPDITAVAKMQEPSATMPPRPAGSIARVAAIIAVLLAVLVVIALLARSDSTAPAPTPRPDLDTVAPSAPTQPDPDRPTSPSLPADPLAEPRALLAEGKVKRARELLLKLLPKQRALPELHYLLGQSYFADLWCKDGMKSFRDAIERNPAYRNDPALIKSAVYGLAHDTHHPAVSRFLIREIGAPARPALTEMAETYKRKEVRERADRVLRRLPR